ncbi:related to cleavage stimulation factor 64K chain [Rhynchosporium agropyri]|uniref:Related to cleavage stimulation factor 64K chain n=1 Tax=Rhynchosporium agropyri TaxID=914238 RepID=A0A1E1LLC6_9HELO|nr:related to cleavage stimulation factor 64K chain [Rhynchosporium agropyri]
MSKAPSKSVFVGNIPYGLTEEQIIRIFSTAGKVLNFRLVYDRETGRPKGFGFVEFPDSDSAASAVRNLNDHEIMNRKLRVDFSNDGDSDDTAAPAGYQHQPPPMAFPMPMQMPSNGFPPPPPNQDNNRNSSIPPLPLGVDLPAGLSCPDAISRTLNTLPPAQLLDVLSQMKTLATTDAARATELLNQAPQLSYAIFQALLLMGLVSTEALSSVVEQASAAPPLQMPPQQQQQQQYAAPSSSYPPGFPPPPPHMSGQLGLQMGTPPVHGQGYPPPPPPQQRAPPPQQQQVAQQQQSNPETEALMAQVMAMPQELIDSLPPADRAQLLALRASYGR